MSILSVWIGKLFKSMEVKEITSDSIEDIIAQFDIPYYRVRDGKYRTIGKDDLEYFLKDDLTNKLAFEKDFYDCDDFAMKLVVDARAWTKGLSIGYCVLVEDGNKHAVNLFIDIDNKVWIIEPQTDKIEPYREQEMEFVLI